MRDFRGREVRPGDVIIYVGRQDLKAFLNEATVEDVRGETVIARPTRSSSPLDQPSGRRVKLTVARKIVVLSRGKQRP